MVYIPFLHIFELYYKNVGRFFFCSHHVGRQGLTWVVYVTVDVIQCTLDLRSAFRSVSVLGWPAWNCVSRLWAYCVYVAGGWMERVYRICKHMFPINLLLQHTTEPSLTLLPHTNICTVCVRLYKQ